jgi:hypothetical protein
LANDTTGPPGRKAEDLIDRLLATDGPIDEDLLDTLARDLRSEVDLAQGQDDWGERIHQLANHPTPPPPSQGPVVDWTAVAKEVSRFDRPQQESRAPRAVKWRIPIIGAALAIAAGTLLYLNVPRYSIDPTETKAPRIEETFRGSPTAANNGLRLLSGPPVGATAGEVALKFEAETERPLDRGTLRIRYLRGKGQLAIPTEQPTWNLKSESKRTEILIRLQLPPGHHPLEVSVLDDLQREYHAVVGLQLGP